MTDQKITPPPVPTSAQDTKETVKKHILVAEDDQFYGNIFKLKLSSAGYDVEVAQDGQQAITAALKHKPELILLDLIMPVKDGFETLKELKSNPELKDIKVVIMSNLGQDDDIQKTTALGAADYLVKTNLSLKEMVAAVEKHLAT